MKQGAAFYVKNRERLKALLPPKSLALLFSNDEMPRSGDQYYPFRQNSDLYYLSGIVQPQTILVLCPDHPNPKFKEILYLLQSDATRET